MICRKLLLSICRKALVYKILPQSEVGCRKARLWERGGDGMSREVGGVGGGGEGFFYLSPISPRGRVCVCVCVGGGGIFLCLSVCIYLCCRSLRGRCLFVALSVSLSLSVCLSVRRFVCLSVALSVSLSVALFVSVTFCPSLCPSFCLSLCPSLCLSLPRFVCLSVLRFVCLSTRHFAGLSLCLSQTQCLSIRSSHDLLPPWRKGTVPESEAWNVCLSLCLFACRNVSLSVALSVFSPVEMFLCLSLCLSFRLLKCLSVCRSGCLSLPGLLLWLSISPVSVALSVVLSR